MRACPAHDMRSLGASLYHLYTDEPLFLCTGEGRMDKQLSRLEKVRNSLARNLLSQLLCKDPLKRPGPARFLFHLFMTGKLSARLLGQPHEFHIFLSYRVDSDLEHAERL